MVIYPFHRNLFKDKIILLWTNYNFTKYLSTIIITENFISIMAVQMITIDVLIILIIIYEGDWISYIYIWGGPARFQIAVDCHEDCIIVTLLL